MMRALGLTACASVLMAALAAWITHQMERTHLDKVVSQHQQEQIKTLDASVQALERARERGDALTLSLAASDRAIQKLTKEKRDALMQVTRGSTCLGSAALRVLDQAPGISVAALPQATSDAAAADGAVATDTHVATWINDAGAQYEQCRARLDALIQWHTPAQSEGKHDQP